MGKVKILTPLQIADVYFKGPRAIVTQDPSYFSAFDLSRIFERIQERLGFETTLQDIDSVENAHAHFERIGCSTPTVHIFRTCLKIAVDTHTYEDRKAGLMDYNDDYFLGVRRNGERLDTKPDLLNAIRQTCLEQLRIHNRNKPYIAERYEAVKRAFDTHRAPPQPYR